LLIETGNILAKKCNAILVPSSAYIFHDGKNNLAYFDDGISTKILNTYPQLRYKLANEIKKTGNYVFCLTGLVDSRPIIPSKERTFWPNYHLINFPCKPKKVYIPDDGIESIKPLYQSKIKNVDSVPGYMGFARKGIVEESIKELELLIPEKWNRICIPKFEEKDINAMLCSLLDNRYIFV